MLALAKFHNSACLARFACIYIFTISPMLFLRMPINHSTIHIFQSSDIILSTILLNPCSILLHQMNSCSGSFSPFWPNTYRHTDLLCGVPFPDSDSVWHLVHCVKVHCDAEGDSNFVCTSISATYGSRGVVNLHRQVQLRQCISWEWKWSWS